jgi:serine-type D-Ala-D-Ala carboxypeptidase/endopeptidase (penicillin-binding protein 4)
VHAARIAIFLFFLVFQVAAGDLQTTVNSIVSSAKIGGGTASVCIIDTETDKLLVEIRSSTSMIPASNQKLLTSGAALHILGPSFQFETKVLWDEGSKTLTIIGDGDPTIGDPSLLGVTDWKTENQALENELVPWVSAIQNAGIKSINSIKVDDRIFDHSFVHPSWPADQINSWYCAQVSGLNYHLNVVHFLPSPRTKTASLGEIAPKMPWITFGNKTTSKRGKNNSSSFWVARLPNSNKMTARGNVKGKHTEPVKIAFHNPAAVFGEVLARELRSNNIQVATVKQVAQNAPQNKGVLIFTNQTPLSVALKRSNTDSHNLYAESLLKRIAAASTNSSGTFDDGGKAVAKSVSQRLAINPASLTPTDGSGMSRKNKVSTKILARWLASFDPDDPAGKKLLDSLATPGTGTLKNRFKNTNIEGSTVHAKSGYLLGICSLSGYVTFDTRPPLVFSIIVNNVKGTVKGAKTMQERIVFAAIKDLMSN